MALCIVSNGQDDFVYDPDYASFGEKEYLGEEFYVVKLNRKNMRVRAKYFANEMGGKSVGQRFAEWSKNKKLICYSSGAYMNDFNASKAGLVGLSVDYGTVVNRNIKAGELHALVVVYPNGGIDVCNLALGTIKLKSGGTEKSYNMNDAYDINEFVAWAEQEKLTVFQTHLLAHSNQLKVGSNGSSNARERRFLVIGSKNEKPYHYLIHKPKAASLFNSTRAVKEYMNSKGIIVDAIINLDTGAQDVFRFYNYDGTVSGKLNGQLQVENARNLIVYYYQ
jgi:hypothetical protein